MEILRDSTEMFKTALPGIVTGVGIIVIIDSARNTLYRQESLINASILGGSMPILIKLFTKVPPSCLGFTAGLIASIVH